MKYSLGQLQNDFRKGVQPKYLFFWGHRPTKDGSVSQSCLSQWWMAPFKVEGSTFASAEHWMMHQKALLFSDGEMAAAILEAKSSAQAKKLGRKVKDFSPEVWEAHKYQIVVAGNHHKFSQHPELQTFLVNTKTACWSRPAQWIEFGGLGWQKIIPILKTPCYGKEKTYWGLP